MSKKEVALAIQPATVMASAAAVFHHSPEKSALLGHPLLHQPPFKDGREVWCEKVGNDWGDIVGEQRRAKNGHHHGKQSAEGEHKTPFRAPEPEKDEQSQNGNIQEYVGVRHKILQSSNLCGDIDPSGFAAHE
ncbi:MAG: hypothetical protein RR828_04540 [Oscillospiraceae bacterium]